MDEIASLKSELERLEKKLLEIENKKAKFFDDRSIHPDLEEVEKTTRRRITEIKKRLKELGADRSQGGVVNIPFVVVAMTHDEATDLFEESIFEDPGVAAAERMRFQQFKEALEGHDIDDLLSHYGESQKAWMLHIHPQGAIEEVVWETIDHFNRSSREKPGAPLLQVQFCCAEFFKNNPTERRQMWEQLRQSGCVLIVDAVSLFHPILRQRLLQSGAPSNDRVAMLVLSPVNFRSIKANELLEEIIDSQMEMAFVRFDEQWDKLCEIGIGDLRALQRWLFAVLPDMADIVQKQRPNPSNQKIMRKQIGEPVGTAQLIFGR